MCLRDVFGHFTLVADCTPIVSCDGRALRYHLRWSVQCQLHLLHNRLLTYNRKDIDLSRTWPPILGTPVDPEPNIRWYLNDVSRMSGRWKWSTETSGIIFVQSPPLFYRRARTSTMKVGPAAIQKSQNHTVHVCTRA